MPILSYQQIVSQLKPQDLANASSQTISQLMQLFAREKKVFDTYAYRDERTVEGHIMKDHIWFGSLDSYRSAEWFLSTLTTSEKEAVKILSHILSWDLTRLIRYPKFTYLFAVGSGLYEKSYREDLAKHLNKMPEDLVEYHGSAQEEEDNTNLRHISISKDKLQKTIEQKGNDIDLIFTGSHHLYKIYDPKELRKKYIMEYIPTLLKQHNIPFSYEEGQREDGSSYYFDMSHKVLLQFKNLNPFQNKQHPLIIRFPGCRPIHLDVVSETIDDRRHTEDSYRREFALLQSSLIEADIFANLIQKNLEGNELLIPEYLSLEDKMKMVRSYKKQTNRELTNKVLADKKTKIENNTLNNTEFPLDMPF